YRERMEANRAMGMTGIWSLTPEQVEVANRAPLPPETGTWLLSVGDDSTELTRRDDTFVYEGADVSLEQLGEDSYRLAVGGTTRDLDGDELHEELLDLVEYVPSLDDIVDSMEEFEAAKEAGKGAIAMTREATLEIDGVTVDVRTDRMWDEATYQAAQTPILVFQDVYENRPDQHEELEDTYGADVVERATRVGN
ncbi:MAG: malate synthase, partial [Halobaculum sp.]